ncbi:hypothetical protein ABPG74_015764 [Tetrahymena malaccensis]
MQSRGYLNPRGTVSHVLDLYQNSLTRLSTREPEKLQKAEIILQKPIMRNSNLQSLQNLSNTFQDHKDLGTIQHTMQIEYNSQQSVAMEQNDNIKEIEIQENQGSYAFNRGQQSSLQQDFIIKMSDSKLNQQEKEAQFVKQQEQEITFIQNNDQLTQSNTKKIRLDFQQLQSSKLKEYQQLEEKKKFCEFDKKQIKRVKFKYQKILHYYQTQLHKMEQQLLELTQIYPFLLDNESINNILDIQDEDTQKLKQIKQQQEQEMSDDQEFAQKQQTLSGQIDQEDSSNERAISQQNYNITHLTNKNQKQMSYISIQSNQSLMDIKIQDYSNINLTSKNALSSQQEANQNRFINKKHQSTMRSEEQILILNNIFQKSIQDITKYICSKKIKINGQPHAVYVVDAKKVIEKSLQLKQIKKSLIQKQDECLEKLEELFKVNFWPKEYKYTREKGSKEKQKQIQEEIEKNKPLLYQNKLLLLDISKKKFEMKKENPQKKREIQKLENYLIKRHQDERKLSKKLQLHNQMKNFIMYSIRYVADNIAYDDPEDIDRQKKILKYFHLAYNKSDLQALVSPYIPYTIQNIKHIISLDNKKDQFKYNQFFDYQKQMISQYKQCLQEQNSSESENKPIQVSDLTWEDLLNNPQVLEKFNTEIARLNMFNKYNRIFMQRFCLFEYHKIILKGKGNKIDHFYGNNFILSALQNPKIIQL